jgi:Fur family peroxide stress response transcriptional regulator
MSRTDQFVAALRTAGYRITPQRVAVCRALAESREHPTPLALFERLSKELPGLSQATVYNTLSLLRDLDEVVEVGAGQERTHYEPDLRPHVNLICLRCGKIEDLDEPEIAPLSERVAAAQRMRLKSARLDLYGYCQACQATPAGRADEG